MPSVSRNSADELPVTVTSVGTSVAVSAAVSPSISGGPPVTMAPVVSMSAMAPAPADLPAASVSLAISGGLPVTRAPVVSMPGIAPATGAPPAGPVRAGIEVNTSELPVPKPGVSVAVLSTPRALPSPQADPSAEGAFRLVCNWSGMSFDDPIVYPGKTGAAHHHTFFGNTLIDAITTTENIRSRGNATCRGGTINMSGYWTPSVIDTATGKPLEPRYLIVYYKTGAWPFMGDGSQIQPIPKGLRMITGDASAVTESDASFACHIDQVGNRPGNWNGTIPHCPAGDLLRMRISFPQCWDGINLDSPDHKSHMARVERFNNGMLPYRCPLSHPVVLPHITYTIDYSIPAGSDTRKWRLSSDTYDASKPGGLSMHADWINGWDHEISTLWGIKCMRERRDCGSAVLGDGRVTMEFQGN